MKKLHVYIIMLLLASIFVECSSNLSPKTKEEKSTDDLLKRIKENEEKMGLLHLGEFTVLRTDNSGIVQFTGPKGDVFLSTTMFRQTSQVEITQNTSDGLIQDNYQLMVIQSGFIMFANNTFLITIYTTAPLEPDVVSNVENRRVSAEGLLKTIYSNKKVRIDREPSPYKFNSITIR